MTSQITIIIIGFVALALLQWYLNTRDNNRADNQSIQMLHSQMNELSRVVDEKLGKSTEKMHDTVKEQFKETREQTKNFTKKLAEVEQATEQVLDITKSLEDLEKVLKNQKQRGSLGEAGLELTLQNVLPPSAYEMQYGFEDGEAVDAVIHASDGMIPIDAKFSLDNYQRLVNEDDEDKHKKLEREFKQDLKKRINETAKYIREDEGTLPFALMYIPAEGIYYDLLVNEVGTIKVNTRSLIEYALKEKKVVIVSPTTLLAYLHTILQGLRSMQISKNAERIQEGVESLRKHFHAFEERHKRLGGSLNTVVNHYEKSNVKLRGLGRDVSKITDAEFELDGEVVENPRLSDEEAD